MKRQIALLLAVMMICGTLPSVSAKTDAIGHVFYCDDFGEEFIGSSGDWYITSKTAGNYIDVDIINGNGVWHWQRNERSRMVALLNLPEISNFNVENLVFQFKLRNDDSIIKEMKLNGISGSGESLNLFSFDNTGFLNFHNEPCSYLPQREFTEFAVVMDLHNKTQSLFIEGKKIYSRQYITPLDTIGSMEFSIPVSAGKSNLYFDYILIYEAETYFTYEQVRTKYDVIQKGISKKPMREELSQFAQGYTMFAVNANYAYFDNARHEIPTRVYEDYYGVMVPVRYCGEAFGAKVVYTPEKTVITKNGKTLTLKEGSDVLLVDGMAKKLPIPVVMNDGTMYVPYQAYLEEFGSVYSEEKLLVVGEGFKEKLTERITLQEMYFYLMYYKPEPKEIQEAYENSPVSGLHPRLFYTAQSVEAIKKQIDTCEEKKIWFNKMLLEADELLDKEPPTIFIYDGLRSTSEILRVSTLALAYMFTKEENYGKAMWRDLEAFCNFRDLNHRRHFLDTSAYMLAVSLAYDWGYDYLNPQQRSMVEHALRKMAVSPGMRSHQGLGSFSSSYWTDVDMNWNVVCNAGLIVSALALYDTDPEYYSRVISAGFRGIEYFLPNYDPDGGYYEGLLYWAYATYNLVYIYESFESVMGTLFGYYDVFNISKTGTFPIHMNGAKYSFNFGDSEANRVVSDLSYYFAKKNGDRDFAAVVMQQLNEFGINDGKNMLRWYDSDFPTKGKIEMPLDSFYRNIETGTLRERWNDSGAVYVGYQGGSNIGGHAQLDIGTFVLDALGERFAEDLGRDNYNYPGYFGDQRWNYYMVRGEGHNVLLANPKGRQHDQPLGAKSKLIKKVSKQGGAYAVLDTSQAYYEEVSSAKRGYMLTNYRRTVVIRDEVNFVASGNDIWWFMHTRANIEILDGGKRALLSIGDKMCVVSLQCSEPSAVFSVTQPVSFLESPRPPASYITEIKNVQKLTVHTKADAGNFDITVSIRPVETDSEKEFDQLIDYGGIDSWEVNDEKRVDSGIDNILINGDQIMNFNPENTNYEMFVEGDAFPEIKVLSKNGFVTELKQPDKLPGIATIKVYQENAPDNFYIVRINYKIPLLEGIPQNMEEVKIVAYTASAEPQANNGAKNAFDNNFDTRWAVEGNCDMILDLGIAKEFDGVAVAFYMGDQRVNYFSVDTSLDGVTWKNLYDGETTGNTANYMTILCEEAKARYIRFNFTGTSSGSWNSILELRVIKNKK